MEFYLKRKGVGESHRKIPIANNAITIGSDKSNSIVIEEKQISKNQCTVSLKDTEVFVKDCDSINGTYINGKRIESEVKLEVNNVIGLGVCTTLPFDSDSFIYSMKSENKIRDDLFNFKSSEIDSNLKNKISDIISSLDDDTDFEPVDIALSNSNFDKIILDEICPNLLNEDATKKTDTSFRKRRRKDDSFSRENETKKRKVDKTSRRKEPSLYDEVAIKFAKSICTKTVSVVVAKLPTTMNKMYQQHSLNSIKGSRKRRRSVDVQLPKPKRAKTDVKVVKATNRESKRVIKEIQQSNPKKLVSKVKEETKRNESSCPEKKLDNKVTPKKSKAALLHDDPSWISSRTPKFTKTVSISPSRKDSKKTKRVSRDYEEFVEFRGAKLISDLTDDSSSESNEAITPKRKRRYTIIFESKPSIVKSILKTNVKPANAKKKISFCKSVFIRNFYQDEELLNSSEKRRS